MGIDAPSRGQGRGVRCVGVLGSRRCRLRHGNPHPASRRRGALRARPCEGDDGRLRSTRRLRRFGRGRHRNPGHRQPATGRAAAHGRHHRGHRCRHLGMERPDRTDPGQRTMGRDRRPYARRTGSRVDRDLAVTGAPRRPGALRRTALEALRRADRALRVRGEDLPSRRPLGVGAGPRARAQLDTRRQARMDVRHAPRHHRTQAPGRRAAQERGAAESHRRGGRHRRLGAGSGRGHPDVDTPDARDPWRVAGLRAHAGHGDRLLRPRGEAGDPGGRRAGDGHRRGLGSRTAPRPRGRPGVVGACRGPRGVRERPAGPAAGRVPGHHAAQGAARGTRRTARAAARDAPVHRRRRHHHRPPRQGHLAQPGGRKADRLAQRRGEGARGRTGLPRRR